MATEGEFLSEGVNPSGLPDDVVRLDHVRKEYGNFVAVQDADFGIGRGEFFSMLGPSGCGKTTTLRMIAGFEYPTAGRVLLEGVDVSSVPPYKRNVNTVFQQYALFPHMSVAENIAFGLRSKGGIPDADIRRRVGEMLEIVRLGEFARRRPMQLSGGQQQRVALARALVNLPSALLLDEPLAALDLKLRQAMQIELKRIQREVGITFVFVTHDQEEALTMSDRIAVMSQGNVEQIGSPQEIYNNPSSIFVAGFIGSANLLPGEIVDRDGDAYVVQLRSGPRVRLPGTGGTIGDPVTVMVRPERLHPSFDEPDTPNAVRGRITNVIFQGDSMRVLQVLGDNTELVLHLEAGSDGSRLQPGAEVWTSWADDAGYLMRGWSAIVGATTTDVDEVQATLDGKDAPLIAGAPEPVGGSRVNRRALLIGGGVVAAGVIGAVLLANAGNSGGDDTASADPGDTGGAGGLGQGADDVRILNWPEYIDLSEDEAIGTVERFEEETGVSVDYSDAFNDNNEVFGKELEVYLGRGDPANFDIVCPTYWMAARLKGLGWLDPLPIELIPNFQNLDPQYLTLNWDKGAHYFLPWQAGYTGIAVNESVTGRPLTKFAELFEPEFRGQVGMFTEMRDTLGLVMLMQGNDPSTATEEQMNQALDFLAEQTNNGQIRAFTGNEYIEDIDNGNFAACIAWSGDILGSSSNPDVSFVYPEEGAISWFDAMVIPRGAPNAVAAARWMNFVYDPVQAAQITAWVQYVSPVVGVQDELRKMGGDAAALADNELLFPTDETRSRFRVFADIPSEVEERITVRFLEITGG